MTTEQNSPYYAVQEHFSIHLEFPSYHLTLSNEGIMLDDPSNDASYYLSLEQLATLMKTHSTQIIENGHYQGA